MERTLYEILGVKATATNAEIKAAYKVLAKKYHPDVNPGNPHAEELFKLIVGAYQVLSDERKRSDYDLKLLYAFQRGTYSGTPGKGGRRPPVNHQPPVSPFSQRTYGMPKQQYQTKSDIKAEKEETDYFLNAFYAITVVVVTLVMLGYWVVSYYNTHEAKTLNRLNKFDAAIEMDDEFGPAYWNRAKLRESQAKYESALSDLRKAMDLKAAPADSALALRAALKYRLGDYTGSYFSFGELKRLRKPLRDELFMYALCCAKLNNLSEGLAAGKQLCSVIDRKPEHCYLYAEFLRTSKQTAEACRWYKKAAEAGLSSAQERLKNLNCTP